MAPAWLRRRQIAAPSPTTFDNIVGPDIAVAVTLLETRQMVAPSAVAACPAAKTVVRLAALAAPTLPLGDVAAPVAPLVRPAATARVPVACIA